MAGTTANYGLATGVVADDLIEPGHHNRVADTLDRVLGSFLKRMMADGAHSGWVLTTAGTVGAGEGLVSGCWCQTAAAQAVEGLTAGALNHVFAGPDETSAPAGTVRFFAALSETKPPGAAYLGTMSVEAGGEVTAVDSAAAGVDRNCLRLEIGEVSGSGLEEDVPAGQTVTVEVEHGAELPVPGALEVTVSSSGFSWEVREAYRADGFVIAATNNGSQAADFVYEWARRGFVG